MATQMDAETTQNKMYSELEVKWYTNRFHVILKYEEVLISLKTYREHDHLKLLWKLHLILLHFSLFSFL